MYLYEESLSVTYTSLRKEWITAGLMLSVVLSAVPFKARSHRELISNSDSDSTVLLCLVSSAYFLSLRETVSGSGKSCCASTFPARTPMSIKPWTSSNSHQIPMDLMSLFTNFTANYAIASLCSRLGGLWPWAENRLIVTWWYLCSTCRSVSSGTTSPASDCQMRKLCNMLYTLRSHLVCCFLLLLLDQTSSKFQTLPCRSHFERFYKLHFPTSLLFCLSARHPDYECGGKIIDIKRRNAKWCRPIG